MKVSVRNWTSEQSGREITNQFVISTEEGTYFQSYQTVIVFMPIDGGKTQLDENRWDYSVTTGRYRNQFLGEKKAETQRKIDSGEYELVDLN